MNGMRNVIIGSGPAGYTAAVYALGARLDRRCSRAQPQAAR